ncbi:MAG: restriction endonuclease subunit S [Clostridia bacterium]|nr:restriction endonuclease subunit S [Clostridia bacterium]
MVQTVALKELCEIDITDGTHKTPIYADQGYIFLSSKNVTSGSIDWDNVMYIPKELHEELYARLAPQRDDILLAKNGTTGIAAIVDRDEVFDIYVSLALIRPDKRKITPRYLLHAINSEPSKEFFNSHLKGIGVPNLHLTHIRETPIKVPTFEHQKKIIRVLDKMDNLISLRKQQLAKLDELVKARFVELFDLENCERKSLGECTDFVDYRGHTPELSDEGTIRMVNAKSVGKGFFKYVDEYITEETYDSWMHRGFGYAGDILFVTEGHTFGNTCLIPDDMTKFALGQRVITIKGHKDIYNAFLCSYMQTDMFWQDINVYRTGGTAQGIRSKDLVKVTVPIPSLDLQEKFVCFVKQTDKSKSAIQHSLDKLEMLKGALMQEYFG